MPKATKPTAKGKKPGAAKAPAKADVNKPLDARESRFVDEYLIDLSPERAALAAGYSPSMAKTKAYTWVSDGKSKPHVFSEVTRRKEKRAERTEITADRVVQELAKVGFASMRSFMRVDQDGQPQIDLSGASDDALDCLAEISTETVLESQGRDEPPLRVRKAKIKLHDKLKALHDLADHTGVFDRRDKAQATALAEAFEQIWSRSSKAPIRKGDEAGQ